MEPRTRSLYNVLLVEDSPADARLLELALEDQNLSCTLHWAASYREALSFIEQGPNHPDFPQLILLDMYLTDRSGLDLLRYLRAERYLDIPVVVLSSTNFPHQLDESRRLGANDFLVKEGDFEQFSHKLATTLAGWGILSRDTS